MQMQRLERCPEIKRVKERVAFLLAPWNLPLLFGLLCRWIERGSILASSDEMDSAKWSVQMTKREAEGRCCDRTVWRQRFIFLCIRNLCGRRCKVWTRQRTRTKKTSGDVKCRAGKEADLWGLKCSAKEILSREDKSRKTTETNSWRVGHKGTAGKWQRKTAREDDVWQINKGRRHGEVGGGWGDGAQRMIRSQNNSRFRD